MLVSSYSFFISDYIFLFIILVFKIYGHRGLCQICVLTTGDKVTYVFVYYVVTAALSTQYTFSFNVYFCHQSVAQNVTINI